MAEPTGRRIESGVWEGFDLIHSYTRAEAIEDGMLIDVTEIANEMGFRYSTAITHAVWCGCIEWGTAENERKGIVQDQDQRLRHVLWQLLIAIRTHAAPDDDRVFFDVLRVPRDGASSEAQAVPLMSVCGPDDTIEPVITISLPGED